METDEALRVVTCKWTSASAAGPMDHQVGEADVGPAHADQDLSNPYIDLHFEIDSRAGPLYAFWKRTDRL